MQSRRIHTNIARTTFPTHQPDGVSCFSNCSLLSRIINAPRLTLTKYYISQDSIAYRFVLSMLCLRALRFARSTSARDFFVAFGFSRCMLSLPFSVSPILLPGGVPHVRRFCFSNTLSFAGCRSLAAYFRFGGQMEKWQS